MTLCVSQHRDGELLVQCALKAQNLAWWFLCGNRHSAHGACMLVRFGQVFGVNHLALQPGPRVLESGLSRMYLFWYGAWNLGKNTSFRDGKCVRMQEHTHSTIYIFHTHQSFPTQYLGKKDVKRLYKLLYHVSISKCSWPGFEEFSRGPGFYHGLSCRTWACCSVMGICGFCVVRLIDTIDF